jgi:hypothetical protein
VYDLQSARVTPCGRQVLEAVGAAEQAGEQLRAALQERGSL